MTVDITGREYPAVGPYHVGSEEIRNFAAAVKNTHPLHHDVAAARAAGHKDLVAPPTFLVSISQRAEALMVNDPDAAVDFARVVHADQRFRSEEHTSELQSRGHIVCRLLPEKKK